MAYYNFHSILKKTVQMYSRVINYALEYSSAFIKKSLKVENINNNSIPISDVIIVRHVIKHVCIKNSKMPPSVHINLITRIIFNITHYY